MLPYSVILNILGVTFAVVGAFLLVNFSSKVHFCFVPLFSVIYASF